MNQKKPGPEAEASDLKGAIHDVNQLLAAIVARAGLLLHHDDLPDWRGHVQAIERAATDAGAILLRSAGGRREAAESATSLLDAVRTTAALMLPPDTPRWSDAPDAQWRLDCDVPARWRTTVPGLVLRETLNNLLRNAIEAAPGGVVLRIGASSRDGMHVLCVADDGPGIQAGLRERLLLEPASSKSGEDRGVGLFACRERLRAVGADLVLAAAGGEGAAFEILLPPAPDGAPAAGSPQVAPDSNVLIVDDEPTVREMLAEVLGELGAAVVAVRNAEQARAEFANGRYDLLLIDRNLPGTSGDELARELRTIDPAVAIVLISGWESETDAAEIDSAGIDRMETKPLGWNRLQDILTAGVTLARSRRKQ